MNFGNSCFRQLIDWLENREIIEFFSLLEKPKFLNYSKWVEFVLLCMRKSDLNLMNLDQCLWSVCHTNCPANSCNFRWILYCGFRLSADFADIVDSLFLQRIQFLFRSVFPSSINVCFFMRDWSFSSARCEVDGINQYHLINSMFPRNLPAGISFASCFEIIFCYPPLVTFECVSGLDDCAYCEIVSDSVCVCVCVWVKLLLKILLFRTKRFRTQREHGSPRNGKLF